MSGQETPHTNTTNWLNFYINKQFMYNSCPTPVQSDLQFIVKFWFNWPSKWPLLNWGVRSGNSTHQHYWLTDTQSETKYGLEGQGVVGIGIWVVV